jgi:hypothetical protein
MSANHAPWLSDTVKKKKKKKGRQIKKVIRQGQNCGLCLKAKI